MREAVQQVTLVVVTYNSAEVLPGLLGTLPADAGGRTYRLVVVDNASADASVQLAADAGATVVRLPGNLGYAAGVNAGTAAAPADAYVVLNPDVRLQPDTLDHLLDALAEPGVGVAAPRLTGEDGAPVLSLRREPTLLRAWGEALLGGRAGRLAPFGEVVHDPRAYERPQDVDWACGALLAVSDACLRQVGDWDESLFLYSEETDYCLRARRAGWRVRYVPAARAVHLEGESGTSPALWAVLVRNKLVVYGRDRGPVATALYRGALLTGQLGRALAGRGTSRAAVRALLPARGTA